MWPPARVGIGVEIQQAKMCGKLARASRTVRCRAWRSAEAPAWPICPKPTTRAGKSTPSPVISAGPGTAGQFLTGAGFRPPARPAPASERNRSAASRRARSLRRRWPVSTRSGVGRLGRCRTWMAGRLEPWPGTAAATGRRLTGDAQGLDQIHAGGKAVLRLLGQGPTDDRPIRLPATASGSACRVEVLHHAAAARWCR